MRPSRGALSLALLLGSVNAGCVNFRPPPVPLAPSIAGDAPTRVWAGRVGRRLTGKVQVQENTLYAGGMDRKVYAVDLATGDVRWSSRLSGMIVGGVLLSGDTVFVATSRPEGRIQALHKAKGTRLWRVRTNPVAAPLALIEGTLIAETQRGEVLALDPSNGKVRWRRRVGTARGPATPAGPGAVLVSTTDSLFRLSLADGKITHRANSPGAVLSSWLPYKGALVAGTADSQIVSIRPGDLGYNWRRTVDAPILETPALVADTLFVATRVGSVYRVDPGPDPKVARVVQLGWPVTSPITTAGGQLFLGGADGTIRALRSDGSEVWRLRIWRPVELGLIPLADGLLAIGGNGDLYRYRR
jgi:outer membrane protein assembly factor BamB